MDNTTNTQFIFVSYCNTHCHIGRCDTKDDCNQVSTPASKLYLHI